MVVKTEVCCLNRPNFESQLQIKLGIVLLNLKLITLAIIFNIDPGCFR